MLDDEYGDDANEHVRELIGFQTYRYLELAMRTPLETLAECKTQDDVREAYKKTNIANFVDPSRDLRRRPRGAGDHQAQTRDPRHRRRGQAHPRGAEAQHLRPHRRVRARSDALAASVETMLDEREWLLHELFEY